MSVLIKGMEMPKSCAECPMLYDGDACYLSGMWNEGRFMLLCSNGHTDEYRLGQFPYKEKRVDWCPLVEVPIKHEGIANKTGMSDLISRAEAFKVLSEYYNHKTKIQHDALWDALGKVPLEEPKAGKWKEVQSYGSSTNTAICECSACGDTVWVYTGNRAWKYCQNCGAKMEGWVYTGNRAWKYCPNCGAKMEGGE